MTTKVVDCDCVIFWHALDTDCSMQAMLCHLGMRPTCVQTIKSFLRLDLHLRRALIPGLHGKHSYYMTTRLGSSKTDAGVCESCRVE